MNENRLAGYLDHMQQAAADACAFVQGMTQGEFLGDKRTQQAVIMSLIIVGEAAHQPTHAACVVPQLHPGAVARLAGRSSSSGCCGTPARGAASAP
jgi:hypothetical protein